MGILRGPLWGLCGCESHVKNVWGVGSVCGSHVGSFGGGLFGLFLESVWFVWGPMWGSHVWSICRICVVSVCVVCVSCECGMCGFCVESVLS